MKDQPVLDAIIAELNQIPDDERKQQKFDLLLAIMQGETANFSAGVYVSLLAGFAIAVGMTGIDPFSTLAQLSQHTRAETKRLLKEQGITSEGRRPKRLDG